MAAGQCLNWRRSGEGVTGIRVNLGGGQERENEWSKRGHGLETAKDFKYLRPAKGISYLRPGRTERG